ncbi:MAG: alanine racemase, partial [Candidatus Omnitrophica bacterium]|nr:alanine racemase [Candidatus Omnitrophota bacterium]
MSKKRDDIGYRPTWAEVDLTAVAHNVKAVRRLIEPHVLVMACVKADAYGHGLIQVSRKLVSCGVDYFGVASIDEGACLRQAGIRTPILILGLIQQESIPALLKFSLTPAVCEADFARALQKYCRRRNSRISVHIKVDTGMGRIGVSRANAVSLAREIAGLKNVAIEGIFTHLACADTNRRFTLEQIDILKAILSEVRGLGIRIPLAHAANSMGVIGYKESHFNMVRPGLMLYGLYPRDNLNVTLKAVLSLRTKVVYAKRLPAGRGVSYGHTYTLSKAATVVTLPIGYGDGYPRNLSNQAPVLIEGKLFRISGRVCMDQLMVDVGNMDVRAGDEAVLIGAQGKKKITAEELAGL